MIIDAKQTDAREINELARKSEDIDINIVNSLGHRYIAAGSKGKIFRIKGVAGNALGAYLDGSKVYVEGNAQDAVGDTMNGGEIVIDGSSGDATGYAMRGGRIFVRGNSGYRAGIHMKSYRDKIPALVIGGSAGDFLGEYQAGGIIAVLNLANEKCAVGRMCGTGMHGGKIFLRSALPSDLPVQVKARKATEEDMREVMPILGEFAKAFGMDFACVQGEYYVLAPDTANPYKRLYVNN